MEDYKTHKYKKKPFEHNQPPKNAPKLPKITTIQEKTKESKVS